MAGTRWGTVSAIVIGALTASADAAVRLEARGQLVATGRAEVQLLLHTDGEAIGGLQSDLLFDRRVLELVEPGCRLAAAISDRAPGCDDEPPAAPCKSLSGRSASCATMPLPDGCFADENLYLARNLVAATGVLNRNPIPDGALLLTCSLRVVDSSRLPALVQISNAVAASVDGGRVEVSAGSANISQGPLGTPLPTWTRAHTWTASPTRTPPPTWTRQPTRTPLPTSTPRPTSTATFTFTHTATHSATPTPTAFASIDVGIGQVVGGRAEVAITLRSNGFGVVNFQNDILFDNSVVRLASACRINPQIGAIADGCEGDPVVGPCKTLSQHEGDCGTPPQLPGCDGVPSGISRLRAIVVGFTSVNEIPDGSLLYTCTFEVIDASRLPAILSNENVLAVDADPQRLPSGGESGYIGDRDNPPPTRTPTRTPTASPASTQRSIAAELELIAGAATAGELELQVVLRTGTFRIAAVQNDLVYDRSVLHLENAASCRINPEIGTNGPECEEVEVTAPCKSLYRHLAHCDEQPSPSGCEGGPDIFGWFRGLIVAVGVPNNNPIPDGTVLYTCSFRVVAPERLPAAIESRNVILSGPSGERQDAVDGEAEVGGPLATATRTVSSAPTPTPRSQAQGFPCARPEHCETGYCVDGNCCQSAACGIGEYCSISTRPGECQPRSAADEDCNIDSDCLTLNCHPGSAGTSVGRCGPVRTPTPRGGDVCSNDAQCAPLKCNVAEGGLCCDQAVCPTGSSCRIPGNEHRCAPVPEATQSPTLASEAPPTATIRSTALATRTATSIPPTRPTAVVLYDESGCSTASGHARGGCTWLIPAAIGLWWLRRRIARFDRFF